MSTVHSCLIHIHVCSSLLTHEQESGRSEDPDHGYKAEFTYVHIKARAPSMCVLTLPLPHMFGSDQMPIHGLVLCESRLGMLTSPHGSPFQSLLHSLISPCYGNLEIVVASELVISSFIVCWSLCLQTRINPWIPVLISWVNTVEQFPLQEEQRQGRKRACCYSQGLFIQGQSMHCHNV